MVWVATMEGASLVVADHQVQVVVEPRAVVPLEVQ